MVMFFPVYENNVGGLSHGCMRLCTWGTATFSDGLHRRVPAVASSPWTSEHIRTHGLFVGQKSSQLTAIITHNERSTKRSS